jgi:hypothetical protein
MTFGVLELAPAFLSPATNAASIRAAISPLRASKLAPSKAGAAPALQDWQASLADV